MLSNFVISAQKHLNCKISFPNIVKEPVLNVFFKHRDIIFWYKWAVQIQTIASVHWHKGNVTSSRGRCGIYMASSVVRRTATNDSMPVTAGAALLIHSVNHTGNSGGMKAIHVSRLSHFFKNWFFFSYENA